MKIQQIIEWEIPDEMLVSETESAFDIARGMIADQFKESYWPTVTNWDFQEIK